ncbi:LuxR family transcriptional regulator [Actinomadura sp. KC216]|uniref:helix-turn-helix transcriptional regulator n=1 Tax=Actinomadura sp. KC216 TaxID=2530370 RepID=UPI00104B776A|nr:helix-turn-helix transcriptional regulator [Actinomadura sp. KC216]TDB77358.1 LuxR family transcriptional regulator [Actinomadura sp. KC216]
MSMPRIDHVRFDTRHLRAIAEAGYQVGRPAGTDAAPAALEALRPVLPYEAFEVVEYDPAAGVHRVLTFAGYTPQVAAAGATEFLDTVAFRYTSGHRVTGRIGLPELAGFEKSEYYAKYLDPDGWVAGMTAPLLLNDGRYVGMLHFSSTDAAAFGPTECALMDAVSPIIARIVDATRGATLPAMMIPPGFSALAFTADGRSAAVAVEEPDPASRPPRLPELVRRFLATGRTEARRHWIDPAGRWHAVRLLRAYQHTVSGTEPIGVVAIRQGPAPYGLTARELDVLSEVALGKTTADIAIQLRVSSRTITTHLEHLMTKLSCTTRTQAATLAHDEGLVRLDLDRLPFTPSP